MRPKASPRHTSAPHTSAAAPDRSPRVTVTPHHGRRPAAFVHATSISTHRAPLAPFSRPAYVGLMTATKVDRILESAEAEHASDPERAELIRCTRRFKA